MNHTPSEGPPALVVYESMFGCTEAVARAVADGLTDAGFETRVVDVREAEPPPHEGFHLLVVGAPTHAFSLSRPRTRQDAVRQGGRPEAGSTGLREWLTAMGSNDGLHRPAAAFDTRVTKVRHIPKAASTRAAHLLTRHSFRVITRPAPFLVQDISGPLVPGELERAQLGPPRGPLPATTAVCPAPLLRPEEPSGRTAPSRMTFCPVAVAPAGGPST